MKYILHQERVLLGDEMGLGKTIQAIATAEVLRRNRLAGSVIVVCPTSLKYQWKSEIERFAGAEVIFPLIPPRPSLISCFKDQPAQ